MACTFRSRTNPEQETVRNQRWCGVTAGWRLMPVDSRFRGNDEFGTARDLEMCNDLEVR